MKQIQIYIILSILIVPAASCQRANKKQDTTTESKLTEINFQDPNYTDLLLYAKDTVTENGWSIKYLVKNDSSKYNDIYIQCSKGNLKGLFYGEELLQYRRYFIPEFVRETDSHIYFTHGCATDCSAVLVFSKDSTSKYTDYINVVGYNLDFEQVVYVTDSCYKNEENIYELALVDLKNNKTHKITYKNICSSVFKPSCIDTIIFGSKQVTIKTTLRESIESEKEVSQTKIIEL